MRKTILIILAIVLCIIIAIPATFLIGVGVSEYNDKKEEEFLKKQATINIEAYIKEKYPDKNLKIDTVNTDALYNGFVQSGWDDIVEAVLKDDNNKTYKCITNGSLKGEDGIKSCRDNVQENEIKNAIISKVKESVNLTTNGVATMSDFEKNKTIEEIVEFDRMYRGNLFYEKFENDIVKFLNNHKNSDGETVEVRVWIAYANKTINIEQIKNTEVLDLLEFVSFIEFENSVPLNSNIYTKIDAEWIYDNLTKLGEKFNNIYSYNKASKEYQLFIKQETITV